MAKSKTLSELQSDIEAREAAASPGTASEAIYGVLIELLEILQNDKPSQGDKASDSKEIASLKAHITKLDGTINWQADIMQKTKAALAMPDEITFVNMPGYAGSVLADALKWKETVR